MAGPNDQTQPTDEVQGPHSPGPPVPTAPPTRPAEEEDDRDELDPPADGLRIDDAGFDRLLAHLHRSRGFDFTAYKRTTLTRRVRHRLQTLGVDSFEAYLDYLEVHPDEFGQLFNTILINVTSFYRDAAAWDYLAAEIVPRLLASKRQGETVRCWVAGCASGEEAYTLAMVLSEAMGAQDFALRVKIYATDLNNGDLNLARLGTYPAKAALTLPARLRERYLRPSGHHLAVDPELRRGVVFGRHDLLTDSPISRVDLLLCRNTLMYFNAEAQTRVLERLHFALLPDGFLFLGKAEMLLTNGDLFTPIDLKRRVFSRVGRPGPARAAAPVLTDPGPPGADPTAALRDAAMQTAPLAQIVVDAAGVLVAANSRARALLNLAPSDLGRPIAELHVARRPVDLAAGIARAAASARPLMLKEVDWESGDSGARSFDVQFAPLLGPGGDPLGASVTYTEVTAVKRLREDLQQASLDRETTSEELQTTNEELQSTVEELETTNEELQSTNEELETMNEELQSTNEELRHTNVQLREQSSELDRVNAFWRGVLGRVGTGIVVVDAEFRILTWNARAADLWGLREDEVQGKNLLSLDIGLPVDLLKSPIRAALAPGEPPQPLTLAATNRRGRRIQCRISFAPIGLEDRTGLVGQGVVLLMEETQA